SLPSAKRGQIRWLRLRVRKCVRMRTQENPKESKSGRIGRSGETSRNVRKRRGLGFERLGFLCEFFGRDAGIRTRDPLNPIQVRYQTAPRPDRKGGFEQVRRALSNLTGRFPR